jgi:hypothetical protein
VLPPQGRRSKSLGDEEFQISKFKCQRNDKMTKIKNNPGIME